MALTNRKGYPIRRGSPSRGPTRRPNYPVRPVPPRHAPRLPPAPRRRTPERRPYSPNAPTPRHRPRFNPTPRRISPFRVAGRRVFGRLAGRLPDINYYPAQSWLPDGFNVNGWKLVNGPWRYGGVGSYKISRDYIDWRTFKNGPITGQWVQTDPGNVVDMSTSGSFGIWYQFDTQTFVDIGRVRSALVAAYEWVGGQGANQNVVYDPNIVGRPARRAVVLSAAEPSIWPMLDPLSVPPLAPMPRHQPLPYKALPRLRPNPWRSPTEQSHAGYSPGHATTISPGQNSPYPWPKPGESTTITINPGQPPVSETKPEVRQPPPPGAKESKLKFKGSWAMGQLIVGSVTEGLDFATALWDALPKRYKGKWFRNKDGKWRNTDSATEKLQKIFDHWDKIDKSEALRNHLNNQLEDWWIGKTQSAFNKGALRNNSYYQRVFGVGHGPAFDKSWDAFSDLGKPQINENWELTWGT